MSREKEMNILKCWLFRNAEVKWKKSPEYVNELFAKLKIYDYVEESYELLHVSSYESALNEVEAIAKANGVDVYA